MNPTHIPVVRRVLRYLAGTRSFGITYRRYGQDDATEKNKNIGKERKIKISKNQTVCGGLVSPRRRTLCIFDHSLQVLSSLYVPVFMSPLSLSIIHTQ
jgi:hypothetical protein